MIDGQYATRAGHIWVVADTPRLRHRLSNARVGPTDIQGEFRLYPINDDSWRFLDELVAEGFVLTRGLDGVPG